MPRSQSNVTQSAGDENEATGGDAKVQNYVSVRPMSRLKMLEGRGGLQSPNVGGPEGTSKSVVIKVNGPIWRAGR